jgi:uncharacterized protein involved in high-affinity Fe2+ transport
LKRMTYVLAGIASALILSACSSMDSTTSELPTGNPGKSADFVIVTDWTRLPSGHDGVSDLWVRIVKIESVCYTQSGSVHDWTYNLVPSGATC